MTSCKSAEEKWQVEGREETLSKLTEWIGSSSGATVALDFPFAPPCGVFPADTWAERLDEITERCRDAELFVSECRKEFTGNVRRETEQERGGLCSYSPQMRYQTFHGIADVLSPLRSVSGVRIEPMGSGQGSTAVIETYPAAVLDGFDGAYRNGYKQKRLQAHVRRRENVRVLVNEGVDFDDYRWVTVADDNALDSVLAAYASSQAALSGFDAPDDMYDPIEGHIYA